MHRSRFYFLLVAAAVILPIAGYGIMHLLIYAFPMREGSSWTYMLYTLVLIVLGLAIPYWMLKAAAGAASVRNREEKVFHLSDIPKDQDEIHREQSKQIRRPARPQARSRRAH